LNCHRADPFTATGEEPIGLGGASQLATDNSSYRATVYACAKGADYLIK